MTARVSPKRPAPRPDREGKRMIATHLEADIYRAFKILAAEQTATTGELMCISLKLLFSEFGKPVPASLTRHIKHIRETAKPRGLPVRRGPHPRANGVEP